MRVSEFKGLCSDSLTHCPVCEQKLKVTSAMKFCTHEALNHANKSKINYYYNNLNINVIDLFIYKDEYDQGEDIHLKLLLYNEKTVLLGKQINYETSKSTTIDKLIDFDLRKINYESLRDIITFI